MPIKSIIAFYVFVFALLSIDESYSSTVYNKSVSGYSFYDKGGIDAVELYSLGFYMGTLVKECKFDDKKTRRVAEEIYYKIKYSNPNERLWTAAGKEIISKYKCKKRK